MNLEGEISVLDICFILSDFLRAIGNHKLRPISLPLEPLLGYSSISVILHRSKSMAPQLVQLVSLGLLETQTFVCDLIDA
jgi:hypothetical protein